MTVTLCFVILGKHLEINFNNFSRLLFIFYFEKKIELEYMPKNTGLYVQAAGRVNVLHVRGGMLGKRGVPREDSGPALKPG